MGASAPQGGRKDGRYVAEIKTTMKRLRPIPYAKELGGVKYWVQWYSPGGRLRYEVFAFVGENKQYGSYLFESMQVPGRYLAKYQNELRARGFGPFCYDTASVSAFFDKVDKLEQPQPQPPLSLIPFPTTESPDGGKDGA